MIRARYSAKKVTSSSLSQLISASLTTEALAAYSRKIHPSATKSFEVFNPANGKLIGVVPSADANHINHVSEVAMKTWNASWKFTTGRERSLIIGKMAKLLRERKDEIALLMTLESGKPLSESIGELNYAVSFYDFYAEEAKRIPGDIIESPLRGRKLLAIRQPVGPAALITPWNFPAAMITRKIAPALAAGCTVVIKPSEETPFTALALIALAEEAGVPPGVINIVTVGREDIVEAGKALCHNENLRKLSFTGSTNVGKWLLRECANNIKKVSLELGGNAPFIVFEDADLDVAINALMNSKFRNAGQTCISSNRILVQETVYEAFAKKLQARVEGLKVGNGTDADVLLGPLINRKGLEKVSKHVEDSLAKGATAITGGSPHKSLNQQGGSFYLPTVLTGVTVDMLPFQEETFGPIAPLFSFKTEEEAIILANNTKYGLAAYACTRDLARSFRVAEAMEFGMVGVNEGGISHENIPFGGIKESGLGREGGSYGLDEFLQIKYICLGGLGK